MYDEIVANVARLDSAGNIDDGASMSACISEFVQALCKPTGQYRFVIREGTDVFRIYRTNEARVPTMNTVPALSEELNESNATRTSALSRLFVDTSGW
jgi:hypothetical protein